MAFQGARIQKQHVLAVAQAARHLIENSTAYSCVFDFGALRQTGQLDVVKLQIEQAPQRAQDRDLECCAARQAAAYGHVGGNVQGDRRYLIASRA